MTVIHRRREPAKAVPPLAMRVRDLTLRLFNKVRRMTRPMKKAMSLLCSALSSRPPSYHSEPFLLCQLYT